MAVTTVYYGRLRTSAEDGYVQIPTDQSAAMVGDRAADNMWVTAAAFVGGRSSGTQPDVRISVYNTDGSKDPTSRVGYFAKVKPSTSMVGVGGGSLVAASIEHSDNGPTDAALMLFAGKRYAMDIRAFDHGLGVSVKVLDFPTIDNPRLYRRTSPVDPPADPYDSTTSQSPVGAWTGYLSGYRNDPPNAPVGGLAPSGTVSSNAPTFTADFDDNNGTWGGVHAGANVGDCLNRYEIWLTSVADQNTYLWKQTYKATDDEVAADQVSRAYGGSTLTRGTPYRWKIRYSDQFGEWGDWSAWITFTPSATGFVTLDSNPTGTITDNTPDFNGRWNHQAATTMKRVQVRILSKRGTVLQTGADYDIVDVASSALPGTLFTVPWASSGLSTLSWGQTYQYQIRGYDGTQWSDWSAARSFTLNTAPRIANHLSPNGTIVSVAPTLRFTLSDADNDYTNGLVGKVIITSPANTVALGTATYNPVSHKWEILVPGTYLATEGYGVYTWTAYGYDGTLYSGEQTVEANATQSAQATFDYEAGPVVAVAAPTDGTTLTSAVNTVSWSVTSGGPQVKYRVIVYADGTTTIAYDSHTITSTATSHEIPAGYLKNGVSYDLVVAVTNGTPVTGYSDIVNLAVAFTPPDNVQNLQLDQVTVGTDPFPTANRLTWDQTIYGLPDFQWLTVYRSADGGPDADRIILTRITSPDTTSFTDYTPASGYEYTYGVTVTVLIGSDLVESDELQATSTITLQGTVLTLLGNGGTYRANLLNVSDRSADRQVQEAVYQSPAEDKPVTVRSAVRYWIGSYAGSIVDDAYGIATAKERRDELDALDAQNGVVCVRTGDGGKRFGYLTGLKITDHNGIWYDVAFGLREELASEGIV